MDTNLQIYSDKYKEEMIIRIAKFFGFHLGLSSSGLISKIDYKTAEQDLNDWTSGDNQLYMIMSTEDVIGFLRIGYRGGNVAWIEDIFVDEAFRNKGVATESIKQAEDMIKAKPQYTAICFDVVPRNVEALKLYHKLGYDTLSMITVRKELKNKESVGFQNLGGLDFRL